MESFFHSLKAELMGTPATIKQKIRDLTSFLFLATPNSIASRWCPWEIGYADGDPKSRPLSARPGRGRWGHLIATCSPSRSAAACEYRPAMIRP